ncbi:hypothetical protein BKA70DRAFT_171772 [Coprinopsis sp. MPI-PUGE-AT-0042]|nr:hypothetical protein BKA70DRAFT_171772 [Coprinopsis sp. MPI-PUGE-AT-0042]
MRAIALAHETNVLQILPYLYYCASRISLHRLLKDRQATSAGVSKLSSSQAANGCDTPNYPSPIPSCASFSGHHSVKAGLHVRIREDQRMSGGLCSALKRRIR